MKLKSGLKVEHLRHRSIAITKMRISKIKNKFVRSVGRVSLKVILFLLSNAIGAVAIVIMIAAYVIYLFTKIWPKKQEKN